MRNLLRCLIAWLALAPWGAVNAANFMLAPPSSEVRFRAYGLGFVPIDGQFTRFTGTLALEPDDPFACRVAVVADATSLRMPDSIMTDDALGPDFLDARVYPRFEYDGQCIGSTLQGTLLLHGTRLPLTLNVTRRAGSWVAEGTMRRAEWGMGARPRLAGQDVQIRFAITLPK